MSAWRPPRTSEPSGACNRPRATKLHSLLAARPLVSSYSLYSLLAHRRRWDKEQTLSRLLGARTNVSKLSAAQLLKKDVKMVQDVYVPSFPILVEEFLLKPGALTAVTEALSTSGCSLALLLGMSLQNELKRDAAICGNETDKTAKILPFIAYAPGNISPSMDEAFSTISQNGHFSRLPLFRTTKSERF
ncbi:hypothetical protein MSG28_015838 [Choristoneura fumiferana]|uniref:Uncharacterized protein n=1 Tax=Choristoneura fumiferana TaxID=7141 RepID=A0ACC0K4C9_CHOFU|nr:hypothetical protein MSG28_015838 [Choristoneura fumiferana]